MKFENLEIYFARFVVGLLIFSVLILIMHLHDLYKYKKPFD